jgi:para-nitrobenzyl esterase
MASHSPQVEIPAGKVRGRRDDGVEAFCGLPYAAPAGGANRFRPPLPPARWSSVRDATIAAAICPQAPARLRFAMGDAVARQDEDCLTVTVWTPAADNAGRPVLVWLHGGAYVSGGGALEWYSGARLAREGDLVVVGVNYRLGSLGYLYHPGFSAGNLGLLDQQAALQWVRDNIAAFGGDAGKVTVWGQSAGGQSAAFLLMRPQSRGLFQRAILQSPPLGAPPRRPADAAAAAEDLVRELGIEQSGAVLERLQQVPVATLLAAQAAVAGRLAAGTARDGRPLLPFTPVADGTILPASADHDAALRQAAGLVDVLAGSTREEMAIFFAINPAVQNLDRAPIPTSEIERLQARRPAASPSQIFCDYVGERIFINRTRAWAADAAASGRRAFVYQFDWTSPQQGLEACHCLDLPFTFGTREAFATAPMLDGADSHEIDALSSVMRASWIAFARDGDPNHRGLPSWPVFDESRSAIMHFDKVCGAVGQAKAR